MTKEQRYADLIARVKESYKNGIDNLVWCDECQEINLWTYWQGRGHLSTKIMVVGQDWGNPQGAKVMENIRSMNEGKKCLYMKGNKSLTDNNLIELFKVLGYKIDEDNEKNKDLFFTNLVLGYRTGNDSGGYKKKWGNRDKVYLKELINIIEPQIILCLGSAASNAVLKGFDKDEVTGFEKKIESGQNIERITLESNKKADVFILAHCGYYGTMNRTLYKQEQDWEKIKPYLD